VATDPFGKLRAGFEATTTLKRRAWGLAWNVALEAGGLPVGDRVTVHLNVSAVKRDT
jgi:polyisoprenoid-binding protein YceI